MPFQSALQQKLPGIDQTAVPKYRYRLYRAQSASGMVAAYVSGGAGDAIMGEVTTASLAGVRIQASTDDHAMLIDLPADLDVKGDIDVRVLWSSDQTTTADAYTWTLKHTELVLDATSINTAGATALDTAIASDENIATANAIQRTEWGTINGGTLTGNSGEGYLHTFLLDPASVGGTIATDLVIIWGIQFRYLPKYV